MTSWHFRLRFDLLCIDYSNYLNVIVYAVFQYLESISRNSFTLIATNVAPSVVYSISVTIEFRITSSSEYQNGLSSLLHLDFTLVQLKVIQQFVIALELKESVSNKDKYLIQNLFETIMCRRVLL